MMMTYAHHAHHRPSSNTANHHIHVKPYYTHMKVLYRASMPSTRRGCAEILGDMYLGKIPLPRIPTVRAQGSTRYPFNGQTDIRSPQRTSGIGSPQILMRTDIDRTRCRGLNTQ